MASHNFTIELSLSLLTPLSIGAGGSTEGFGDKTIIRDATGHLIIPGSHFKGRVRHACEMLAKAAGYGVCGGPEASQLCPQPGLKGRSGVVPVLAGKSQTFCIICQMFGSPALPSAIQFADLVMADPYDSEQASCKDDAEKLVAVVKKRQGLHGLATLRSGVSINRSRGVAEDSRLFFIETSRPGLASIFKTTCPIEVNFPQLAGVPGAPGLDEYRKLLEAGLRFLRQWGGGKTRGLGWANITYQITDTPVQEVVAAKTPVKGDSTKKIELLLTLEAQSPLCLGERRPGGQFRASLSYLTGRVVRGMLANALKRGGQETLLEDLFGTAQGQLEHYFGNAWPVRKADPKNDKDRSEAYLSGFQAPVTARICKHQGDDGETGKHLFFDTLFDSLAYERFSQTAPRGPVYLPGCPDCGDRVEGFSKRIYQSGQGYSIIPDPSRRLLTRVGINRKRAAAEDSLLYSPMVLNEGSLFQTRLLLPAELAQRLEAFLNTHPTLHAGSGGSRGLGWINVAEVKSQPDLDRSAVIKQQVAAFNQALTGRFTEGWRLPRPAQWFFTLNARSDWAWPDPFHPIRPYEDKNNQINLGTGLADLTIERLYTGTNRSSGWNNMWGLYSDVRLVVTTGSVYVLSVPEARKDDPTLYDGLAALELTGIGEGQAEGLGSLSVCEPFHYKHLWQPVKAN